MEENVDLLRDIMRILTVNEINELTTVSDVVTAVPITDLLLKKIDNKRKPKILPAGETPSSREENSEKEEIKNKPEKEKIKSEEKIEKNIEKEEELEANNTVKVGKSGGFTITDLNANKDARKKKKKRGKSIGEFVLEEKNKLKGSQKKLKEQEVIGMYKENAAVEVKKQSNEEEVDSDVDTSTDLGILINKKQK